MGEENVRKKRDREDSSELDSDQCEPKRVHRPSPNSPGFVEIIGINNGIPEDILDGLDDDGDNMPENQYLDSVIRSFEEEILSPSPSTKAPPPSSADIMNRRSDSGEYQLDLGYLLEASDDELGLPPTDSEQQQKQQEHLNQDPIDLLSRKSSQSGDLGDMFGFENEIPNYSDSIGFEFDEMAGGAVVDNSDGGFVGAVDGGLFEYSEPLDPSADLSWLCGCT